MIQDKKLIFGNPLEQVHDITVEKIAEVMLNIMRSSMGGIVYSLEAKDAYSQRHSVRVAQMAKRFAERLGHSSSEISEIYLAATVHDIGKIGIPDSVLLYPGKLDDTQWDIMKTHPKIGAQILEKSAEFAAEGPGLDITPLVPSLFYKLMEEIMEGVLHHHERYNGSGYPDSLTGKQIPYISRIIAICDSTDAMLSNRVYRKALYYDFCKEDLEKNSGIMYDPDLLSVFIENWDYIIGDLYVEEQETAKSM